MTNIKDVTVNGVNYHIDENFQAVKGAGPIKTAESVLSDGNDYFSIVREDYHASPSEIKYPVVSNNNQKGILTGKITVTMDSGADANDINRSLKNLGYEQIGGRGRAILLQRSDTDVLRAVEDVKQLTRIEGVEKASPQIIFQKSYR